jgi:mRNA-degrading endonuclease RelE of RelBE toxin-antitoxin system
MFLFIESPLFERQVYDYLDDEGYAAFQAWLAASPDMGDLVPRSGGCRKVRWQIAGKGKRGGVRVIYYVKSRDGRIWLLTIYGKGAVENIPGHVLKALKEEFVDEEEAD